jgi:hypothetical protein
MLVAEAPSLPVIVMELGAPAVFTDPLEPGVKKVVHFDGA